MFIAILELKSLYVADFMFMDRRESTWEVNGSGLISIVPLDTSRSFLLRGTLHVV